MRKHTRNEWRRCKTPLETSGKDVKLHSKRVEKIQPFPPVLNSCFSVCFAPSSRMSRVNMSPPPPTPASALGLRQTLHLTLQGFERKCKLGLVKGSSASMMVVNATLETTLETTLEVELEKASGNNILHNKQGTTLNLNTKCSTTRLQNMMGISSSSCQKTDHFTPLRPRNLQSYWT